MCEVRTELLRSGARELIAQAVEAELLGDQAGDHRHNGARAQGTGCR